MDNGKRFDPVYTTKQAEVASAKIFYAVEQKQGLVVVIGEAGTGKSMLAHQILRRWQSDEAVISAYIHRPDTKYAASFQRQILTAFGLPEHHLAAENESAIHNFLRHRHSVGQTCVLVIDNAHRLSANGRIALQRLFAMNAEENSLLQVVLLAQPVLARKLNGRTFLGRCVSSRATMDELTFEDAWGLLRHRHGDVDFDHVFPEDMQRPLYAAAAGNPRALCLLCDQILAEVSGSGLVPAHKVSQEARQWLSPMTN